MTPILILAAGRSSRMRGRDKLLEPVDGLPLLRRQVMRALQVAPVLVALPSAAHPRAGVLEGLEARLLEVPESAEGLSGTLRGAVARLPDCEAFLVVLADLPEITAEDMARVLGPGNGARIRRGATEDLRPGHPIRFDAQLRPEFAALEGDTGGQEIVRRHRQETELVPLPGLHALRDLDTPEDWAKYRAESGGPAGK